MRQHAAARIWTWAEQALDRVFPGGSNPLRNLGAIACLMFAILLLSGIYLYACFDTSVGGAWRSIDGLSREQPFPGGWLRSMHRYAADVFLLATFGHLLREWVLGHHTRFRRITWLTGIPLLAFAYVSGIGGFWLGWDQLGQYSAQATAQLLDALPLLATSLARNFLIPGAVSDRLFSLLIFVHLGVPLLMLFGLWFHLQRISRPRIVPPRALLSGLLLMLGILAAALPVISHPPADLDQVPTALRLDWVLLHLHPLADAWSTGAVWMLIVGALLLLLLLPFRPVAASAPVAVVDPDNCNGCRRCVDDCPYSAISLDQHPNAKPGRQIAVVAADRCASCGICAGACPSATPFRSVTELATGIDMPQQPIDGLRRQLEQALAQTTASRPIVVFGCAHGVDAHSVPGPDVIGFNLLCIGVLPPSFIEFALRSGAAGVVVGGCAAGACEFRLGNQWTAQRLQGQREPHLRGNVAPASYRMLFANPGDHAVLEAAITGLRNAAAAETAR